MRIFKEILRGIKVERIIAEFNKYPSMTQKNEKKRTQEDYLIERIKESGYPLEIEVSNALDPDYIVFNTSYYFDVDSQKDRDIDIYAIPLENTKVFEDEKLEQRMNPFFLQTEVIIECKKSKTHCWVFFSRPFLRPSNLHTSGQYVDKFSQTLPSDVEGLFFDKLYHNKKMRIHYDLFDEAAIAYHEVKKEGNKKSRNDIFEGLTQLVKFLSYEIGIPKKPDISKPNFQIAFYFPIIVFDGDMYEVTLESGEPKLEKTSHVLIRKNYRSPYTKKVETFLIDIVHRSCLPDFLKLLEKDFRNMRNVILENHDEFIEAADKTRQTYEEAKEKDARSQYAVRIAEEVYGVLFNDIKSIILSLEIKWYRYVDFNTWREMEDDHRYFMVDEEFRTKLSQFRKRLEGYSKTVINVRQDILQKIVIDGIERVFGVKTNKIPTINVTYRKGQNSISAVVNFADCLISLSYPREYATRKMQEISEVSYWLEIKPIGKPPIKYDKVSELEEFWKSILNNLSKNKIYNLMVKENDKLLNEAKKLKQEIATRIEEPWKR